MVDQWLCLPKRSGLTPRELEKAERDMEWSREEDQKTLERQKQEYNKEAAVMKAASAANLKAEEEAFLAKHDELDK